MKKITLKGLADFMTANSVKQRKIIAQFKYPDSDEAQAKIIYYREARDRIAVFHGGNHDREWLQGQIDQLKSLSKQSIGRSKERLNHNALALDHYAENFSSRKFEILKELRLKLQHQDVFVSVIPDLYVREKGKEKLIKLEFSKEEPDQDVVRIMSQGMLEAAVNGGLSLTSASILYLDVRRGKEHRCARVGARTRAEIAAACATISAIWDQL